MLVLAAILSASINVNLDLTPLVRVVTAAEKRTGCGIATVGYRFHGEPGQRFRYAGETFEIPSEGWVELIAHPRRKTYKVGNQAIALEGLSRDPFGFGHVRLPRTEVQHGGSK